MAGSLSAPFDPQHSTGGWHVTHIPPQISRSLARPPSLPLLSARHVYLSTTVDRSGGGCGGAAKHHGACCELGPNKSERRKEWQDAQPFSSRIDEEKLTNPLTILATRIVYRSVATAFFAMPDLSSVTNLPHFPCSATRPSSPSRLFLLVFLLMFPNPNCVYASWGDYSGIGESMVSAQLILCMRMQSPMEASWLWIYHMENTMKMCSR